MKIKKRRFLAITGIIVLVVLLFLAATLIISNNNKYKINTSDGTIVIKLYPNKAPITVNNFEQYVKDGFYTGTVFHRVIPGFMIQGGGYEANGTQKQTMPPIKLESDNGLSNNKYTIAMARTNNPNSATSQFFINTADNSFLNYGVRDQGYAVFGKVIKGQNIVDKIESVQTTTKYGMQNWPVQNIVIESIKKA